MLMNEGAWEWLARQAQTENERLKARVKELEAALRLISHMNDLGNIHTAATDVLREGQDG